MTKETIKQEKTHLYLLRKLHDMLGDEIEFLERRLNLWEKGDE